MGAHRLGLSGTPKGQADLTSFLASIFDQGQTETCHAHSIAQGIFCAYKAAGKPLAFVPSPVLIASTTYADVRAKATPAGQPLPPLDDAGAELQDDADALKSWGIAPIGALIANREGESDVPDDQDGVPFPEPNVAQLQVAGSDLIGGEYSIAVDNTAAEVCALALDAGIPIWTGGLVGKAFQALGPNDIAQPTDPNDKTAGGHAQLLAAYRTNAAGALEFFDVNSWGRGWALNGCVWTSTAYVQSQWDLWPLAVVSK